VNEQFWNPRLSDTNKYVDNNPAKGFVHNGIWAWRNNLRDAWHIVQFFMVLFLALSVISALWSEKFFIFTEHITPSLPVYITIPLDLLAFLGVMGMAWNYPFNLFFNRVLVKEK